MDSNPYPGAALSGPYQIRLLRLEPSPSSGEVVCHLQPYDIEEAANSVSYEAVSYEWGKAGQYEVIKLNGQRFRIQANLFYFLKILRRQSADRVLWVDAICINQCDPIERDQQVRIMRKIYPRAQKVLSWLGVSDDCSDLAFDFCNAVYRTSADDLLSLSSETQLRGRFPVSWTEGTASDDEIRESISDAVDDPEMVLAQLRFCKKSECSESRETGIIESKRQSREQRLAIERVKALNMLVSRSYWGRIWIVPEVALGREVVLHCGNKNMPFDAIEQAMQLFHDQYPIIWSQNRFEDSENQRNAYIEVWTYRTAPSGWSLPQLLQAFGQFECNDIHDRVYALLGTNTYFRRGREMIFDYQCALEELFFDTLLFCTPMGGC